MLPAGPPETCHIGEDPVPNSTARRNARASKPSKNKTAKPARRDQGAGGRHNAGERRLYLQQAQATHPVHPTPHPTTGSTPSHRTS